MKHPITLAFLWGLVCAVALFSPGAEAFFPMGGFEPLTQKIQFLKWPFDYIDANMDGDISGDTDGIEMTPEGGEFGFTQEELEDVYAGFKVWEDVPTAAVRFKFTETLSDPVELSDQVDFINMVSIVTADDPDSVGVTGGVLGLTIITFAITDTIVYSDNVNVPGGDSVSQETDNLKAIGFPVSGPQIIEGDIIINGATTRQPKPGMASLADLKCVIAHEAGHLIGIEHTPLNNLQRLGEYAGFPILAESPVYSQRDSAGTLKLTGLTPTMFPVYFLVDDGSGSFTSGYCDLAPDDIAAVTFLYPRENLDNFFNVQHEARTQTRVNFPSLPIAGGHVTAWCDVDNDPATPRQPMFSTLTGLYENTSLTQGWFNMINMFKEIETTGMQSTIQASYTFTIEPLNGRDITAQGPETWDSMHIINGGLDYNTSFPSEVFHEAGNVFDSSRRDVGTSLVFDREKNGVVSTVTGKTLDTMLPSMRPMFGDPNDVCPLNLIFTATATSKTNSLLRGFRDSFLLRNPVGTALVDAYYSVSPVVARYLLRHEQLLATLQTMAKGVEWVLGAGRATMIMLTALAGLLALGATLARRTRALKPGIATAGIMLVVCAFLVCSGDASATIRFLSTADMEELSDTIVTGTVESTEARWEGQRIVTEVSVKVSDGVKGEVNDADTVTLRLPGGRVGDVMSYCPEMPNFAAGEEVLLYLEYQKNSGFQIEAGKRGKMEVRTDLTTGKKYVSGASKEAQENLKEYNQLKASGATQVEVGAKDGEVGLDSYKEYLKNIKRQREKQQKEGTYKSAKP